MPKAILEFNLPEEREEYDDVMAGAGYRFLLGELYNELRRRWKYGEDQAAATNAEEIWELICRLNEDNLEIP